MSNAAAADIISEIRSFNRYYTNILGLLNQNIYDSGYSLTEARVLYEIGNQDNLCTANRLIEILGIDGGYLSRILKRFEASGLLTRERCAGDARAYKLNLTPQGFGVLDELDQSSEQQIQQLTSHLETKDRRELLAAISLIRSKLDTQAEFAIRSFKPADIDHVISRHQILYGIEQGFDYTFGQDVARTMGQFREDYDPQRENLWIAENGGTRVGCIAIVKANETTAQLRWFLLEPYVRGKGLGRALVNTALEFARSSSYQEVFLWTVDKLQTARQLYGKFGFKPVETAEHHIWGQLLTEEKWALDISK
ncbi:MAG: GNAT family N-acetyltransferase [Methylocystaceae bacterium]